MQDTLNIWLTRNLSLKGKITILKSLALPKLLYVSTNVPVPTAIMKEAESVIFNFLWNHKTPKVKRNVIIQPIEYGGLKAPDFRSMVKASKVAWIKRLLSPGNAKWKVIFQELAPMPIKLLIETHLNEDIIDSMPVFYRQVLSSWNEIKQYPNKAKDYLEQIIWNNKFIQTPVEKNKQKGKISIFYQDFYMAGIFKLKHLISDNGEFIDFGSLHSKFPVKCNILRYQKLKLSIPKNWLQDIKSHATLQSHNFIDSETKQSLINYQLYNEKSIMKCSTRVIYKCFIQKKAETPTALAKWENIFDIDHNDWKVIFELPYSCSRDTALQSFQYRIIQRIFPCNKWFHNLTVISSDLCNYCNMSDTIEHHLFYCKKIDKFWVNLQDWYNEATNEQISLTCKHVILGLYYDNLHFSCINYIILLAKMYIYRQKYNDSPIDIINFLVHLHCKLNIERKICENNTSVENFNVKWSDILRML